MFPESLREAVFRALIFSAKKFLSVLLAFLLSVLGCLALRWLKLLVAAALVSGAALFLARSLF